MMEIVLVFRLVGWGPILGPALMVGIWRVMSALSATLRCCGSMSASEFTVPTRPNGDPRLSVGVDWVDARAYSTGHVRPTGRLP
jgi:hypothetical protein